MPIGTILTGLSAGISLAQNISGARDIRKQADRSMRSIDQQMQTIQKRKEALREAYQKRGEMVTDLYGNRVSSLRDRIGQNLMDIEESYRSNIGQTGLAHSGTLERRRTRARGKQTSAFKFGTQSIYDQMDEQMLNVQMSKNRELSNLETQLSGLQEQRKLFQEQKKTKFLGIF